MSVEVGHMYLDRMTPSTIEAEAIRARKLIDQHVGEREDRVSKVVLIDDYNRYSNPLARWESSMDAQEEVASIFGRQGVNLDHVVLESNLAASVDSMLDMIVEEPRGGSGSTKGPNYEPRWRKGGKTTEWLSNGDAPRSAEPEFVGGALIDDDRLGQAPDQKQEPRFLHSIALDVQLWSLDGNGERKWACPTLAAWWQLVRLGGLQYFAPESEGIPHGSWFREDAAPLQAFRTLTFLEYSYIEVEHAVWNILRQISLPDDWTRLLTSGQNQPLHQTHLDRIAYVFTSGAM